MIQTVPKIPNRNCLCYFLGIKPKELEELLEKIDSYYYRMDKVKTDKFGEPVLDKDGQPKIRVIFPSTGILLKVQHNIRKKILNHIPLLPCIMGGVKGKDNIQNARFHQGSKFKFATDLENYFPSISENLVYKVFLRYGFYPPIADILTKLVTYKGWVPQGIPTSTAIANLVFLPVDKLILDFCRPRRIKYSRFVDDLTFSSQIDFQEETSTLIGIISVADFKISRRKTFYTSGKANITGLWVKNNSLDVSDEFKKKMADTENHTIKQTLGHKIYFARVQRAGPK